MISAQDNVSMALFCDFENVALGVRDANYDKLDIRLVLERLLLKGSIVIKKAYCDWDRYKGFKAAMHEANFELIEIPHVRQSGKNSADIRLVVDALDLCYTKSHVDTFVIISGDSDFSPLVSKLRENAKHVIGVGVKQSTSDLLIANCDEFIFYDDLVRESARSRSRRETREPAASGRRSEDERRRKEDGESRKTQAVEMAVETFDALVAERGDSGKIWASVLKEAIKRRKPDFNESYYGFRAFGNLLEEAQTRGLLEFGRDEKSGTYVYRNQGNAGVGRAGANTSHPVAASLAGAAERALETAGSAPDEDGQAQASQAAGAGSLAGTDGSPAAATASRRRAGRSRGARKSAQSNADPTTGIGKADAATPDTVPASPGSGAAANDAPVPADLRPETTAPPSFLEAEPARLDVPVRQRPASRRKSPKTAAAAPAAEAAGVPAPFPDTQGADARHAVLDGGSSDMRPEPDSAATEVDPASGGEPATGTAAKARAPRKSGTRTRRPRKTPAKVAEG